MIQNGSGAPGVVVDVAMSGDRIAAVSSDISTRKAEMVLDARGLAVAPGFIDPHTHTDVHLIVNPKAESKVRQGVTTEIGGNCGSSGFPLNDRMYEESKCDCERHSRCDGWGAYRGDGREDSEKDGVIYRVVKLNKRRSRVSYG